LLTETCVSKSGNSQKFETNNVKTPRMEETSLIPNIDIAGRHGGITQFLGSKSHNLRLEGIFTASSAKDDLEKLRTFRSHGIAVLIKIAAHGQTWVEDYFTLEKLEWAPRAGRPSASGGEQVDWNMQLKQYVA